MKTPPRPIKVLRCLQCHKLCMPSLRSADWATRYQPDYKSPRTFCRHKIFYDFSEMDSQEFKDLYTVGLIYGNKFISDKRECEKVLLEHELFPERDREHIDELLQRRY